MSVEFTEEDKEYVPTRRSSSDDGSGGESGMKAFLVKNGIVANGNQANYLLLFIAIVAIVVSVVFFRSALSSGNLPAVVTLPPGFSM